MSRFFALVTVAVVSACRSSSSEEAARPAPVPAHSGLVAIPPVSSPVSPAPPPPTAASAAPAGTAAASAKPQKGHRYVCPMHPNVVRHAPGDCPECGMHLVARD